MRTLLKAARKKKPGLTQVKLSRMLGMYKTFVCKYETGERRLDVVEFNWIASKLDLDPSGAVREIGTSYGDDDVKQTPVDEVPQREKKKRQPVRKRKSSK